MDNWHLLWYAAVAVVALRWRRRSCARARADDGDPRRRARPRPVVVFFSSASGGVDDESLVNRLPLQMVVALAFYLALLLRARARRGDTRRSSQPQAYAADA